MSATRPNIVLITTDQQRYDTCGPAAPGFMRTPHFDQLCREGVRFDRAYADCPICVPARTGMMTGQSVFRHGMNRNGRTSDAFGREGTMPALLGALGYQTCAIGKMHFWPERCRHGFQEMILPADYYRWLEKSGSLFQPMRHGLGQNEVYPSMATVPEALTLTSWTAEQAIVYLRERRDPTVPFFLWVSFSKPHPPFDPPEPYYSMYRDADLPVSMEGGWSRDESCPPALLRRRQHQSYDQISPEVTRAARAAYYGLVTQIDYNMGRVFAALADNGLWDNSMIVYTSDHGEMLGDHRMWAKTFGYEASARIPFVLRMPRAWENRCYGHSTQALVTHTDLLSTFVKAAGGDVPDDKDGLDLVGMARGNVEPRDYLEITALDQYFAVTDGKWKYLYYPEGGGEQLFDLVADPRELTNLAGTAKGSTEEQRLRAELIRRMEQRESPFVQNGKLISEPVCEGDPRDLRDAGFPGFVTEYTPHDVKH